MNNVLFWRFFWGKWIRLALRELRKIFSFVFEQFNEKYLNTVILRIQIHNSKKKFRNILTGIFGSNRY